ncbi:LPS export ABC transporter periplasmic protein LptC [Neptunicella marina]|uniref:Lipopolysaccharide export system protein LptC n=1 Tax=Neptunicella marina TaxID=2125989 RepID=A0A8J6M189_9ALTE|nr:LPS export ABC transporter periplasmic protein LptC [Neptunicella marina]MBC3765247.1 LPS export ABC transporter periplasmic protein LptC [Neptunicella marina]
MNKVTISICLLFILVVALNYDQWISTDEVVPLDETEEAWRPNYLADGMLNTLYNSKGELSYQVFAKHMEHYQLLGFTLFEQPMYNLFDENGQNQWQISAQEGTLHENNRLQLEDDVTVKSLDKDGFIQTMKTDYVEIDLNNRTLTSDQLVKISGKNYVIQGEGFSANLEKRTFELLNHAKSTFSPGPTP